MLDTVIAYLKHLDPKLVITVVSVLFLWIWVRAIRGIINIAVITFVIGYMISQNAEAQMFLLSFLS